MLDSHLYRYLDTNGDGTGTANATGDYSVTADDFYLLAGGGEQIHRMIVSVRDTGAFDAASYGNGLALTNGVSVLVYDKNQDTEIDLLGGSNIKTNAEWGAQCYDADVKTWGTGDEMLLVRWTFAKAGAPLRLQKDDKFIVRLNDNFTGLNGHYFQIQGLKI